MYSVLLWGLEITTVWIGHIDSFPSKSAGAADTHLKVSNTQAIPFLVNYYYCLVSEAEFSKEVKTLCSSLTECYCLCFENGKNKKDGKCPMSDLL